MAKLGKYSSGLSDSPSMSSYGGQGSNGGYDQRQKMSITADDDTKLGPRGTATGNRVLVKPKTTTKHR